MKIIKFRGDPSKMSGFIEVRGIVNKDGSLSFGEFTQYDGEFGKNAFKLMIRLGHPRAHARILPWNVQGPLCVRSLCFK